MNGVSAPVSPPSRLTASKYSSNLAWSWPPSACPMFLDHRLQVRTHIASKCISSNSLNQGLQVHLQTRSVTASKSISNVAWLRPPSSHNHGLHVHPQNWLEYVLQVCTITASKCISKTRSFTASKFAQSQPRSASLCSLDHGVVKKWSSKADSPSSPLHRTSHS